MITVVVRKVNRDWLDVNFDLLVESLEASRKERVLRVKKRSGALVQLAAALLLQEVIENNSTLSGGYTLKTGKYGKPYVEELPEFHFNMSHSGEYVVVAYGDVELGVDIESIRGYRKNVAVRCCTDAELEYIEERDTDVRFTEVWTMKESYVKLTGVGMSEDFRKVDIDLVNRCMKNTNSKYITKQYENYIISLCAENIDNVKFVY